MYKLQGHHATISSWQSAMQSDPRMPETSMDLEGQSLQRPQVSTYTVYTNTTVNGMEVFTTCHLYRFPKIIQQSTPIL